MTDWQHLPFHISPNLLEIGSFQLRYYSLMYLVAFGLAYLLVSYRIRKENYEFTTGTIQDYFIWAILGVILGGRLGYVLFYNFDYYMAHPLEIFLPFDFSDGIRFTGISGMSYHGGLVGFLAATVLFCRKAKISFWRFTDLLVPVIPLGYTFGRIGNFINGELYGRATDMPWGMYFPDDREGLLRHPSQLYEAFFEGIVLFALLWFIRKKRPFEGFLAALYLIGYGFARFFIEFVREPDAHLGFVLGPFSMGQVLCFIMIISGVAVWIVRRTKSGPARRLGGG
ncbi:MAG TPA: prolipoprotein diacylglyceryl transferase [Syntrophales bacterium]|nr:prolipoprotein diacylglyceryl transferase [Syntrophales bacterium]HPX55950.1 prolipoprotein diacylglyceryl transferase [Syntrophales bacterium]